MARINLSNGSKSYWFTADEAAEALRFAKDNGITLEVIAGAMDDELREAVAADIAPCSGDEFLTVYLKIADTDLIIG